MSNERLEKTRFVRYSARPNKNEYLVCALTTRDCCTPPLRWHQRDHFPQLNIVSQEETSIICGNYLITHGFHNKGTIIGEQYVNYPCKYKT